MPWGRAGHADRQQPRAEGVLAQDEGCAPCRAGLFAIGIGEQRALARETVDVGRAIAHDAVVVGADVVHADIVSPDDEDVQLV
jgi:hypothetical protein